jgi:hypothetical protein
MKFKVETHLALLVIYSIVTNLKSQPNFIDGIIIVSILTSMLYQAKLEHTKLPDIRKEVKDEFDAFKAQVELNFVRATSSHQDRLEKIEKEATELKNTVAPLVGGRTVGLSNAQIRF